MFPYHGAKTNVIKHYPAPMHDTVIETMCGSARYALKYWDRNVICYDIYPVVINIWKWLQQCSKEDILKLPRMQMGDHVDDKKFTFDCQEAKDLMGFMIGFIPATPRKTATIRMKQKPNSINFTLNRIASNLHKIRHWEFVCDSYMNIPNEKATYFIDPPYQDSGKHYKFYKMNYEYLAKWVLSRQGQVIVCESGQADWLDFKPLIRHNVRSGTQQELVYLNHEHQVLNQQIEIWV